MEKSVQDCGTGTGQLVTWYLLKPRSWFAMRLICRFRGLEYEAIQRMKHHRYTTYIFNINGTENQMNNTSPKYHIFSSSIQDDGICNARFRMVDW